MHEIELTCATESMRSKIPNTRDFLIILSQDSQEQENLNLRKQIESRTPLLTVNKQTHKLKWAWSALRVACHAHALGTLRLLRERDDAGVHLVHSI